MVVVRTLKDAKEAVRRSALPPLVVRLQDKGLIKGAVWIGDLLGKAGVEFVGVFERCALMLAEGINHSDYQQYLAERGCYDLPLRLPADVLARYGPFCVVVPRWLRWDRDAAAKAGCVVVEVSAAEQFAGEVRCRCAANLADQARQVERLGVAAALTSANADSFLFLAMGGRDFPKSRAVRIEGQQGCASLLRRFGLEGRWRQWALLVEAQQVVNWSPKKPFVCPADDAPLLPFSDAAVCGLVEGEGKGEFSIRVGGLVAQGRLYLFRYAEQRGRPVFADVAYEWRCGGKEETVAERASEFGAGLERTRVRLKIPHLSPSALEDYLECPRKFLFKRLGVPEPESAGMLLGSAIHRILELHHKGELRDAEEAAKTFLADKDITPLERRLIIQDAVGLYRRYLASGLAEDARVYACERKFKLTLDGVPFVCKVDRIDRTDEGFVIVDYKRRGKKKEKALLGLFSRHWKDGGEKDYQVPLYVEALRREGLCPVVGFVYIFLDFKNSGRIERVFLPWHRIEERLEGALMSAAELGRHILEDEHFEPPPDPPCTTGRRCAFRHLCGK